MNRQSFEQAPQVRLLSDGAKSFWRIYRTCFQSYTVGILDFYHAAGHLWRAAAAAFNGCSTIATRVSVMAASLMTWARTNGAQDLDSTDLY